MLCNNTKEAPAQRIQLEESDKVPASRPVRTTSGLMRIGVLVRTDLCPFVHCGLYKMQLLE